MPVPRGRPPVLIIVEDNAASFGRLKRALWQSGATARVWWAQDVLDALTIFEGLNAPGMRICVVSDVQRARFNGFDLLARIKQHSGPSLVRFAFLTGSADSATRERALDLGADAFFVSPSDEQGLAATARAIQRLALGIGSP